MRIPPHLVEEAIRSAPPKSCLCGRDPEKDIVLEAGRVHFANFDEGIMFVDPRTGEYRHPMLKDVRDAARLVDALSDIDAYESAVHPVDVPDETSSLHKWEAAILNTGKPVGTEATSGFDCASCSRWRRWSRAARTSSVAARSSASASAPSARSSCRATRREVIVESARAGCPDTILSMAMAGGSTPVTLAGTLVQHNAEVLSGIVLSQLVERGCQVIYGSSTTAMDLKLAAASVGSPELALFSAACAQIARRYLHPELRRRACRRTPSSVTRRPVTRRPSPDSFLRWQGPTRSTGRG